MSSYCSTRYTTSPTPMSMTSYSSTISNTTELENGLQEALGNMRQVELKAMEALKRRDAQLQRSLDEKESIIVELQQELQSLKVEKAKHSSEHDRLQGQVAQLTRINRDVTATADAAKEENARLLRRMSVLEDGERRQQAAVQLAQQQKIEMQTSVQHALQELATERARAAHLEEENRSIIAKIKYTSAEMEMCEKKFALQNDELKRLRAGEAGINELVRNKEEELHRLRENFRNFQTDMQRERDLLRMYSQSHEELNRRITDLSVVD